MAVFYLPYFKYQVSELARNLNVRDHGLNIFEEFQDNFSKAFS